MKTIAPDTWSPILKEASKAGDIKVVPYDIEIGYDSWSYRTSEHMPYSQDKRRLTSTS